MNKLKVVITGHATGLGQALARRFEFDNYTVSGWDVAVNSEHNLMLDSVLDRVVADCEDAVCFVNNARPRQVDYLRAVHELWLDRPNHVIVNIGSCSTYYRTLEQFQKDFAHEPHLHAYYQEKQRLDQTQKELYLSQEYRKVLGPLMIMPRPCWMNTEEHQARSVAKLDVADVADVIFQVLSQLNVFVLTEFVVTAPKNKDMI